MLWVVFIIGTNLFYIFLLMTREVKHYKDKRNLIRGYTAIIHTRNQQFKELRDTVNDIKKQLKQIKQ